MARPQVPDTTFLIHQSRSPRGWEAFQETISRGDIWLSSVAVTELYAGTRSLTDARLLDRFVLAMERDGRVLVPSLDEWRTAGRLVARRVRLHGSLRPWDHLADMLILVSAARIQGTVVTSNVRHFRDWAAIASRSGLDVTVTPYVPDV